MNSSLILTGLCLLLSFTPDQHDVDREKVCNTNVVVYQVDSCLQDVLRDIVSLDTGGVWFPAGEYFYDFLAAYEEEVSEAGRRLVKIVPCRWKKAPSYSYWGIVKVEGMSFLLRGNLKDSSLFHRIESRDTVCFSYISGLWEDSVGARIKSFVQKPTLHGMYSYCSGRPFEFLIAVGRSLPGYKTQKIDRIPK